MYFGRCTMLAPVGHRTYGIRCVGFVLGKKGVLNVAGYFYLTSLALASINHLKVRTILEEMNIFTPRRRSLRYSP